VEGGGSLPLSTVEFVRPLPDPEQTGPSLRPLESLDLEYLGELIERLKEEKGDFTSRLEAVEQSRRLVQVHTSTEGIAGKGTAFQIDESGIYVTARHVLTAHGVDKASGYFNRTFITINNPYNGKTQYARGFVVHKDADMGIVYAPTGEPSRATPNMQFDVMGVKDSEPLWMVGLEPRTDGVNEVQKFGTVIEQSDNLVAVKGMRPFGGTSGSPIIDMNGTIVGVESSYYPKNVTEYDKYEGALIAPINFVENIDRQPRYLY
jgi:hypothetical protein